MNEPEVEKEETKESLFGWGMHELILVIVILLNFLGFFHLLPNEIDFIEKIISWTLLGLLLYHARLSRIFFGEEHKAVDIILILSYFGLIFKDLLEFIQFILEENTASMFMDTYHFLLFYKHIFEGLLFMGSFTVILLLALYVTLKVNFRIPSVMHILHEDGEFKGNIKNFLERLFITSLVFYGFFLIVFNLMAEWLAIAIDDPLLLLGILFFFFKGKKLTMGTRIEKLGSMGEDFYTEFVKLFQSERKIWFALSGMLVLHVLTDIANFIIPYLFGLSSTLYSGFETGHTVIKELIVQGFAQLSTLQDKIMLASGYGLNILAIIFLMLGPAFIWYKIYRQEMFDLKKIFVFIFVASVIYFIINPVFVIGKLESSSIVEDSDEEVIRIAGTDIRTQAIQPNTNLLIISLSAGLAVALLYMIEAVRKWIVLIFTIGVELFFFQYIFYYTWSVGGDYIISLTNLFSIKAWFLLGAFGLFFVINCLFYVGSSVAFLVETWS